MLAAVQLPGGRWENLIAEVERELNAKPNVVRVSRATE
jgi:hypothetical protein